MNATTSTESIGVVVALVSEAKALTGKNTRAASITPFAKDAALYVGGMGPDAARRATQALIDAGANALMVFGVAGALNDRLRNGTLFCPERICDENGREYTPDPVWRSHLLQQIRAVSMTTLEVGSLLSVQTPLLTSAAKHRAHDHYAAQAVDMESAAVAAVAQERHVPFVCLRAIVDEVSDIIPTSLHESIDMYGRPRPLHLTGALIRHPQLLAELPRLYSRMRGAMDALQTAAVALGWHP